jgi:FMN phosphatase YigB (HAD superfamily)
MKAAIFDFNNTLYDPEKDKLVEGSEEILVSLQKKGLKLVLISNPEASEDRIKKIIQLGIYKYFGKIYIVDKKTTALIKKALSALDCFPQDAAVIGDRPDIEIKLGNKAGCTTIRLLYGKYATTKPNDESEIADYNIQKLKEVLDIFIDTNNPNFRLGNEK